MYTHVARSCTCFVVLGTAALHDSTESPAHTPTEQTLSLHTGGNNRCMTVGRSCALGLKARVGSVTWEF